MKSIEEIKSDLKENIIEGVVTVSERNGLITVYCDSKAFFKDSRDYNRVKAYLRNQGFESDRMGSHTRYINSKGDICSAYEHCKEKNRQYANEHVYITSTDILSNAIAEKGRDLYFYEIIEVMEKYGKIWHNNHMNDMLASISK